jgi:ActR/RegA family two-component response regulator
LKELETTLDWLVDYVCAVGVLVVWIDPQKPATIQTLRSALERRGFVVEAATVREDGCAVSARRRDPIAKVA